MTCIVAIAPAQDKLQIVRGYKIEAYNRTCMWQPVLAVLTHKFCPRNVAVIDFNSQAIMHYLNLHRQTSCLKVPVLS